MKVEEAIASVQAKIDQDLFPLALSALEKFMLWDEVEAFPMTCLYELTFASPVDRQALEDSLAFAVHGHPLLVATVSEEQGEFWWQYDPNRRFKLESPESVPKLDDERLAPIDLTQESGLRCWLEQTSDGARLLIQSHHACCDGTGLRRMIIDALTFYAIRTLPLSLPTLGPSWTRLDPSTLLHRFDFSGAFPGPIRKPLSTWQRIKNAHYFHFQTPKPLLPVARHSTQSPATESTAQSPATESTAQSPAAESTAGLLATTCLDRQMSQEIRERCQDKAISINALAVSLMFYTCGLWNQQQGDRNPKSRIRLLMPYDLRSRIDLKMPAANRLSFAFVGREQAACGDLHGLLTSVDQEIKEMKLTRLPLDFIAALEGGAKYPKLMRWILRRSRNVSTVVLTYTGELFRGMTRQFPEEDNTRIIGDTRLANIVGAAPVRENTNIAVCLTINWGQIYFAANWNRHTMTAADCQEFLGLYRSNWERWMNASV